MSRISPTKRRMQIKIKLKRQAKLARLRQKYLKAKTITEKERVLEKASRLAPWLSEKEFLSPVSIKEKAKS